MCGEQVGGVVDAADVVGSPPRVRGTASMEFESAITGGITPACAGNRLMGRFYLAYDRITPACAGNSGSRINQNPQ